jgi:hypothetical protein
MDEKVDTISRSFPCTVCNKLYSSYKSLWKHNKNIHNKDESSIVTILSSSNNTNKTYACEYCTKIFNNRQGKFRHEKTCKQKEIVDNKIKLEIEKVKLAKVKEEIILAKLNRGNTTNNTTNDSHDTTNTNTTNSHNNINKTNNGTINNVYYKYNNISYDTLTKKERNDIFNSHNMIEESIKQIHFNSKYPEQNNIYITNLKDLYGHVFDGKSFVALMKNELLVELIDNHLFELYLSKDKYKLKEATINKITKLEERLEKTNKKYTDVNDKVYKSYKDYMIDMLKLLVYNLSDKNKLEALKKIDSFVCKELELDTDSEI